MKYHKFPYKWKLATKDFTKDKGKVFSCFAAAGGSTMGYKLAGFDVIGMNEIDPKMAECYIENHHPKYTFIEPIQDFVNRKKYPKALYNLDILDGSPPCSSFSMAGKRDRDWGKNKKFREGQTDQVLDTLFFDYIKLAEKLQPKVVIAENVPGILLGNAIKYSQKIYRDLTAAGYYVQRFLLDSSTMGVPQKRKRVFYIGLRKDLAKPFLRKVGLIKIQPKLVLKFNEPIIKFGEIRSKKSIQKVSNHAKFLLKQRNTNDKSLGDINKRLYNKISSFTNLIIHDAFVCPVILAGSQAFRYYDAKHLSNKDIIKASTFPLDFNPCQNKIKYICGMSVPPVMTAQIANQIHKQWLSKINKRKSK